jgi:hypothetical protein
MADTDTSNPVLDADQLGAWIAQLRGPELGSGAALEGFAAWLMPHIPGLSVRQRNTYSYGRASEVDLTLWNDQLESGFRSFAPPILASVRTGRILSVRLRSRGLTGSCGSVAHRTGFS